MNNVINVLIRFTRKNGESSFAGISKGDAEILIDAAKKYTENDGELAIAECAVYEAGKVPFDILPEATKKEVKWFLEAYDTCEVVYENCCFFASPSSVIAAYYPIDHVACGSYRRGQTR